MDAEILDKIGYWQRFSLADGVMPKNSQATPREAADKIVSLLEERDKLNKKINRLEHEQKQTVINCKMVMREFRGNVENSLASSIKSCRSLLPEYD